MTDLAKQVEDCIRFYKKRGWDWTSAAAFLLCEGLGVPWRGVVRTRIGVGYGRPRKAKS